MTWNAEITSEKSPAIVGKVMAFKEKDTCPQHLDNEPRFPQVLFLNSDLQKEPTLGRVTPGRC